MATADEEIEQEVAEYEAEARKNGIDLDFNTLREIPDEAIYDEFPFEGNLIYVLDGEQLLSDQRGELLFMKSTINEEGETILENLTFDEYQRAIDEYQKLNKLFEEEE